MKVLIIGGYGLLGTDIYNYFKNSGHTICRLKKEECDITDIYSLKRSITGFEPDLIVHAAGYTNVELSEQKPMEAYNINSVSMYNLLSSVAESEPTIVFFSTDYVFDGEKGSPYTEEDRCHPINAYGFSKLIAEDILRANYKKYYIVRTSWLFGKSGKCFPEVILNKLVSSTQTLNVVSDQIGSPTYTEDLAKGLVDLLKCPYGTYHVTNSGSTSWFELACSIAQKKRFLGRTYSVHCIK
ncbi:dTDP-4-dehydrorhamnose reductase [Paenibacillus sp. DMB20]|uniref:dTDP-4-dehydrorhamnose reductase n=1 Tax=Paenibacillus sp. DMB20 TaxID=1642570 RepID=UPI00069927B0|nr:dTDP-4-dehydrorhamnose reductase [Paenibacillus sp. DMB20]